LLPKEPEILFISIIGIVSC